MNRVWRGILGWAALSVGASGCILAYEFDFEGGSGGAGGDPAGSGGAGPGGTGGMSSASATSTSSSGNGGSGGGMGACPGCTYGVRFGDDQQQTLTYMKLADDGSLYFSGYYDGEMRLDATHAVQDTAAPGHQPFLGKLDRTGKPLWITNPVDFKSAEGDGGNISIANGIVAWTGRISNLGQDDTFVEIRNVGADATTTTLRKVIGSPSINDALRSSALSPDGKTLFLAGAINGAANYVGGCTKAAAYDTAGNDNVAVVAIDTATGNCLWGKTWTGGFHIGGTISVATGTDGSPFVSGGIFSGTISNNQGFTFPAVPNPSMPKLGYVGFMLKLHKQTGDLLAAKGYANAGFLATAADHSTQTVAAAGPVEGDVLFKGMTLPAATAANDESDSVVLAWDENLNERWVSILGGPNRQAHFNLASNGAGRFYAASLTQDKIDRGAIIGCSSDQLCSLLVALESSNGAVVGNQTRTFGETQTVINMGKTFVTTATPTAIAVGGTWTVPVRFWDNGLLDVTGAAGDFDIAIGKVEPPP